ncbi:hypothetical protein SAMN06265349_10333 [Flavobacterium resistens]|uniref:Natural product n=1 Tax=Flavobacterium resistens TaxID=443612 RepID=A0A521D9H4_9FLAO|nr:hypothetical protein [Flavobacterium resistens]MRX70415.1 hypothetical protein [Flavobacterium resistens]SMO68285.1 hypothetical protein SAMN06265349_10333 [Flavobacterium resistens]
MKTQKISLTALQGKLSRNEMRSIMAGSGTYGSSTTCWGPSTVCYTEGSNTYTCSIDLTREGEDACCCGHDAGHDACIKG